MRSAPANFTPEQLTESVIYAHARGRKVYLTMNTLPTNEEADRLPEAIKEAAKALVAKLGFQTNRRIVVFESDDWGGAGPGDDLAGYCHPAR